MQMEGTVRGDEFGKLLKNYLSIWATILSFPDVVSYLCNNCQIFSDIIISIHQNLVTRKMRESAYDDMKY